MNEKRMDRILIPMLMAVVAIVTLFSFWLSYLKFEKSIKDSQAALIYTISKPFAEKIEYGIKFGKPINRFFGVQAIMAENKVKGEGIEQITVFYPSKSVLYSTDKSTSFAFKTNQSVTFIDKDIRYLCSRGDTSYDILIPIKDAQKQLAAVYAVSISHTLIDRPIIKFVKSSLSYTGTLIILGCIVIGTTLKGLCRKLRWSEDYSKSLKKLVKEDAILIVMAVIMSIQLASAVPMLMKYEKIYQETIKSTSSMLAEAIYDQIKQVVTDKGVRYKDIHNLQEWIDNYKQEIEQVESVSLIPPTHKYGGKYLYELRLPPDAEEEQRTLYVLGSQKYLEQKKQEIIRDAFLIFILSIAIVTESMRYIQNILSVQRMNFSNKTEKKINVNFMRLRIFAFVFAMLSQLPVSFIPIFADKLINDQQGMSSHFMTALAVTLYIMGMMVAAEIAKLYKRWVRWTSALETGLFIITLGLGLLAISNHINWFLAGRFAEGYGFGMVWMAIETSLGNESNVGKKRKIFTSIHLGLLVGTSCAAAIGAMLLDRLDYQYVFGIASIGILILSFGARFILKPIPIPLEAPRSKGKLNKGCFLNMKVIVFMILIILPSSLFIMFLKYYFPLYASGKNLSQSDIGGLFLIYGIIIWYASPFLGKVMCNKLGPRRASCVALVISALAFIIFAFLPGIKTAVSVIVIMALMDSFRAKAENSYFMQLQGVQEIDYVAAMNRYNSIKSLGQALGPMVFVLSSSIGWTTGIGAIGLASLGMFLMYMIYRIGTSNKNYISYNGKGEWF